MHDTVRRRGEDARAIVDGWRAVLGKAAVAARRDREAARTLLPPEITSIGIDFANVVRDTRVESRSSIRILKLEDMVFEIAIILADLEGNPVVGVWGVLLGVDSAVGFQVLEIVAASRLARVRLKAAEQHNVEGASVTNVGMAYTRGFDSVDRCVSTVLGGKFVVKEDGRLRVIRVSNRSSEYWGCKGTHSHEGDKCVCETHVGSELVELYEYPRVDSIASESCQEETVSLARMNSILLKAGMRCGWDRARRRLFLVFISLGSFSPVTAVCLTVTSCGSRTMPSNPDLVPSSQKVAAVHVPLC